MKRKKSQATLSEPSIDEDDLGCLIAKLSKEQQENSAKARHLFSNSQFSEILKCFWH
jgi:hypothetical protein